MPFCRRKCLYCDFYSQTDLSLTDSYVKAVIRNIRAANITADTVYFGGGTPSLLSGAQIYDILLRRIFRRTLRYPPSAIPIPPLSSL